MEELSSSRGSVFSNHQPRMTLINYFWFYYVNIQFWPCPILQTNNNNLQGYYIADVILEVWGQTEWSYQLFFFVNQVHPRLEVYFECVIYICLDGAYGLLTQSAPLTPPDHLLRPCLCIRQYFSELKNWFPNLPLRGWVRQDCIYDETWAAMDAMVTERRERAHRNFQKLIQRISAGLITDWKRRVRGGRTHYWVLPYIGPHQCKRGLGMDTGVVQRCSQ